MNQLRVCICWMILTIWSTSGVAQDIRVATVEREPFSILTDSGFEGFSIDLMNRVSDELGLVVEYELQNGFAACVLQNRR